jgi:hypothetical protein
MADPGIPVGEQTTTNTPPGPARSKDEIALELMKFIAVTTGVGRGAATGAGFSAKPGARSPEEHAELLLELFGRCRRAVNRES